MRTLCCDKLMHFFLPLRRVRVYPCPKIRTDSHKGCPYVYSAFPLKGEFAGLNALLYVCQIVRVGESDAIRPAP